MDPSNLAMTRKWVSLYRETYGLNCLPSDPRPASEGGRKKPMVRFAEWWDSPAPADLFDRFETTNVQIMTGVRWGLCVLDLDGPEAIRTVEREWPSLPHTWVSYHGNGKKSRHIWFRTPRHRAEPKGKTVLWLDELEKHSAVELLCDRSLIMAPPSFHPKTGQRYEFERGRSPLDCKLAEIPRWLWEMPATVPRGTVAPEPELQPLVVQPSTRTDHKADWRDVMRSLPNLRQIAEGWGLRFARSSSESSGWVSVHDIGREDRNPSARFNLISGRFWRPGMARQQTLSLFELGVELGHFTDWQACCNALADYYGIH
jgi:hypothetical protein